MPRTRHDVDRDEKVQEILALARGQVAEDGFAALSMKAIAGDLDVAQNAVYWYFPSRDHLFVAVLREMIAKFADGKPSATQDIGDRAVWFVGRIARFHPLLVDLYDRARVSEVAAGLAAEVDNTLREIVTRLVEPHLPAHEVAVAVDSFWSTIEGALLSGMPRQRRDAVVRFSLRQLIGEAALHENAAEHEKAALPKQCPR